MKKRKIGKISGFFAHLLAIIIALCLFVSFVAWSVVSIAGSSAVYQHTIKNPRVMNEMVRIAQEKITEKSEEYGFDPENIFPLFDEAAFAAYGTEVSDWWVAVLRDDTRDDAPWWDDTSLIAALKADEGLKSSVDKKQLTSVVRDEIAPSITRAAEKATFPVWLNVANLALTMVKNEVGDDYSTLITLLGYLPGALALFSLILALVMLLILHRRPSEMGKYLGSSLTAAALAELILAAGVILSRAVSTLSEISPYAALWFGELAKQSLLKPVISAAAVLAVGVGMMAIRQHKQN